MFVSVVGSGDTVSVWGKLLAELEGTRFSTRVWGTISGGGGLISFPLLLNGGMFEHIANTTTSNTAADAERNSERPSIPGNNRLNQISLEVCLMHAGLRRVLSDCSSLECVAMKASTVLEVLPLQEPWKPDQQDRGRPCRPIQMPYAKHLYAPMEQPAYSRVFCADDGYKSPGDEMSVHICHC